MKMWGDGKPIRKLGRDNIFLITPDEMISLLLVSKVRGLHVYYEKNIKNTWVEGKVH